MPVAFPTRALSVLGLSDALPATSAAIPGTPGYFFTSSVFPPHAEILAPFAASTVKLADTTATPAEVPDASLELSTYPELSSARIDELPVRLPVFDGESPVKLDESDDFPEVVGTILPAIFAPFDPVLGAQGAPMGAFYAFSTISSLDTVFPIDSSGPFEGLCDKLPSIVGASPGPSQVKLGALLVPSDAFEVPLGGYSQPLDQFVLPTESSEFALPF